MHILKSGFSSPWRTLLNQLHQVEKPLAGALLTVGLVATGSSALAQDAEAPIALREASLVSQSVQPLEDGVYLYGQALEPEQLGSAYMVFEVTDRQVVGAFYMPSSSFDCFQGDLQADQLALTIINSYEQTAYPFQVALVPDSSVAMAGEGTIAPMQLEGFNHIETVSENDQRILATCKADLQQ